nr:glycosyltransferase [Candidatus Woesebacteria bacterium]
MASNNENNQSVELSIILISYNTAQITQDTIESIYKSLQKRDMQTFELIVVDNASKDNSVQILEELAKKHSNLRLILSHENLGFSKGNNLAFAQAQGKYVFFLNSDIIVLDDAIEELLHFYK